MFVDRPALARIPDLLETQRRFLESFARSTRIVADAARGCSEHQAALARLALNEFATCVLPTPAALASGSLRERTAELGAFLERFGRETAALQRIMSESLLALLDETRRAWLRPNGAPSQPVAPALAEASAPAAEPQVTTATEETQTAASVSASPPEEEATVAEAPAMVEEATASSETTTETRPRRGRKSAPEA